MKHILTFFVAAALSVAAYASDSLSVVYRIRLDQDIDKAAERIVVKGLEKADEAGADYVLLDLDTYGGAVDAADSIRTAILRYEKPVIAYINMQAASAGALISIACDSIYMRTGSSIGAATVVNQSGEVMPDKYQSFMRGMMRATAQATGRDPKIAESMVDTANVLSLTPEEAIAVGYCEGKAESVDEAVRAVVGGNEFIVKNMEDDMTWLDRLIQLLLNPLLQSIFMMMIIGGIFVEIRTPGIGLPLVTAIVGALLYFAPLYVEHLAASWEILLFVIGLILIALEIFVIPGFGVAGISGIVAVVTALAFAMIDNAELLRWDGTINLQPLLRPVAIVIFSITAAVFGSVWLVRRLYATRTFDTIALRQEMKASEGFTGVVSGLEHFIGDELEVFADLKPSGKVKGTDGRVYEAILAFGGYAEKGSLVKVLRTEQGRLYCEKV
ncbi:MAG: nodulation protein NfeD [Bacteroidales bacterium]|jgi:membrane-bound serine protease (ClpP class)|nr:nodulation protein NfeD [Bacteroidales bacterium]